MPDGEYRASVVYEADGSVAVKVASEVKDAHVGAGDAIEGMGKKSDRAAGNTEKLKKKTKESADEAKRSRKAVEGLAASYARFTGRVQKVVSAFYALKGAVSIVQKIMGTVEVYRAQERSVQSLNAALLSMGRTASGLSANLQGLAAQIQREGIIGDEAIIKGQAFLATYGQISNDMMPRVTRIMADLAAKMGGDTVTAANKLGKAAMGMVGELREVGITVSDAAAHPFGDEDRNIPAHVSHETCARPLSRHRPMFHVKQFAARKWRARIPG